MRYPWIAATIILLWAISTFTILEREEVDPAIILSVTLVAALILGVWGFRMPK